MLLVGAEAHAVPVTFITSGTFDSGDLAGSSTYALNVLDADPNNDIVIDFTTVPGQLADPPPAANVSFGLFSTALTTSPSFVTVSSGFTLTITQLSPDPVFGQTSFSSTLSGELRVAGSTAFIQFNPGELLKTIGPVVYEIVSADDDITGRVNIPLGGASNPVSIAGRISIVPEPSAVVLMGMGAVAPFALTLRRRMKRRASA